MYRQMDRQTDGQWLPRIDIMEESKCAIQVVDSYHLPFHYLPVAGVTIRDCLFDFVSSEPFYQWTFKSKLLTYLLSVYIHWNLSSVFTKNLLLVACFFEISICVEYFLTWFKWIQMTYISKWQHLQTANLRLFTLLSPSLTPSSSLECHWLIPWVL